VIAILILLAMVTFIRAILLGISVIGSVLIVVAFFALVAGVAFLAFAVHRNLLGDESSDR
jgi:hypothetical protein